MRRVLYITHRIPFPPNKGDKIRSFNFLRHLAQDNEVSLATLVDDPADMDGVDSLQEFVQNLAIARIDSVFRKVWSLRALLKGDSISVTHFYSPQLQYEIDRMIERNDFDAVFCSSSPTAEYVIRSRHCDSRLANVTRAMDLIDVDSYKWQQYAARSSVARSWLYRYEAARLAEYECEIYRKFDRLLLVSEQEVSYFPQPDSDNKLCAVRNGVDLSYFAPVERAVIAEQSPRIVFTGMMDYWPNIDGMRWFLDECFPLIQAQFPTVELFIVGGRPTPEVVGWGQKAGVTVTGFVDDIRDFTGSADICITPLIVARGIQNKVLEAMAMAKPVVATPDALEGIGIDPGVHAISAKGAQEFADAIMDLIRNPSVARRIGTAARSFVEEKFSWSSALSVLETQLFESAK